MLCELNSPFCVCLSGAGTVKSPVLVSVMISEIWKRFSV